VFREYAKLNLRNTSYERMKQLTVRVYPAIGHLRLDKITSRHIQQLINNLALNGKSLKNGRPLSRKTAVHHLSFISDVFSYAVKMEMLTDNPCKRVTVPKGEKKEKDIYTLEEVAHLFHEYVYDDKGMISIAKGLNADGFRTTFGGLFRQDSIGHILENPKYCGDLSQWRTHSTDFLTKHRVKTSENEKPECSLIELEDTHEGIIPKELFEKAQEIREHRSRLVKNRSHHSNKHWFSGKIICGKCGAKFTCSSKSKEYYSMHCTNRQVYGKTIRYEADGRKYGCDIPHTSEKIFVVCMQYVLEYIDTQRADIIAALKMDIETIQQDNIVFDIEPLQAELEKLGKKKELST